MGLVLIPVGFLDFNFTFLGIEKRHKNFIRLNYLISLFFFAANFTPYFLPSTSPRYGLNYFTDPGPLYYIYFAYFLLISILCILTFFIGYLRAKGNRKRQLFNLFWSSLLGYSLGGLNFNIVFSLGFPFTAAIGNLGIIFHEIVYAYTITKQRLMDISVVISRAVAEVLTVLFQGTIYLSLVWFYRSYVSTSINSLFLAWTILYGILVGQTYREIRLLIQTSSDKLFLRGRYNYYRSLSDASSHVGEKLSLQNILKVLYDTFHNVVEISNPRVFLPEYFAETEKSSDRYLIYDKRTYLPDAAGQSVRVNSLIVEQLIGGREPLENVEELNAALVVPCMLEDRLIGFFALGHKLSEDPYTDEDMRLLKVLANQAAITLDHTRSYEKIRIDLESVERQLERSQRLASLGTLTAGVTHEIRNPLTVIRAETERLSTQPRDLDYLKQHRDLLLKHIDRITNIVNRMLDLAKDKPKQQIMVDVIDSIESTLQLFSLARLTVEKNFNPVPEIKGDSEELQEIFVNLIQNAIEAMPEGGTLRLSTYLEDGRAAVEISDTGKGIPEELREKIFDPFFSTRHEGVGLGLSIAYRIIRQHGGDIKVTSEVGKGSTFKILF
jgi:signal transduction histidine kinase